MRDCFIRGEEVELCCIVPEDGETFLRWHNDTAMREKIGGIFPFDRNTFHRICCSYGEQEPADIWFAIHRKDKLIGIAGLHSVKYVQRQAEAAIFIGDEAYRHKGIGREAMNLIADYGFGMLSLHRLYALVYEDNTPANCFFDKCGWNREGVLKEASYWNYRFRDVVIWAKINRQNVG